MIEGDDVVLSVVQKSAGQRSIEAYGLAVVAVVLGVLVAFFGVYRDTEFDELHLFRKKTPSLQVYFHCPIKEFRAGERYAADEAAQCAAFRDAVDQRAR